MRKASANATYCFEKILTDKALAYEHQHDEEAYRCEEPIK